MSESDMILIPAEVQTVTMTKVGFVVFLKGVDDGRVLPIHIGPPEAQAILLFLNDVPVPRPLTHDLFRNVLESLAVRIERVVIRDLRKETFFATMTLAAGEKPLVIDCRPSDAIALALRCAAPIFIAESVMDQAGIQLPDAEEQPFGGEDREREFAPEAAAAVEAAARSPLERLREELQKAIAEERYEDAATIRDQIGKLSGSAS